MAIFVLDLTLQATILNKLSLFVGYHSNCYIPTEFKIALEKKEKNETSSLGY